MNIAVSTEVMIAFKTKSVTNHRIDEAVQRYHDIMECHGAVFEDILDVTQPD